MATLLLSAAGAAAGASFGGSVLGLSAAVLGRAVGATIGQSIDQRLLGGGSEPIETGRVDRFRLSGASEGTALARVYGRIRVPGHIIWSSSFVEDRSSRRSGGGGKGSPSGPTVRTYSYSVSIAVALCEGEISHVGRIWADGAELDRSSVDLRVYTGSEVQLPDPKISAVEGAQNAPAYRGTAYVVFEDLDLSPFGNRVPQLSFEVSRPDQGSDKNGAPTLQSGIEAVALIPGTGEYSLATTPVRYQTGVASSKTANVNGFGDKTDLVSSLDQLDAELPNCSSVSLVVSWFGDDLRCDRAQIQPRTEQDVIDGTPMPWSVAGTTRLDAGTVAVEDGRPIYGGTPADTAVVEAIRELRAREKSVLFYPFILMEQTAGNGLPDPWSDAPDQPVLPWRGRITLSVAPGRPGTPDQTDAARLEVDAFFGQALPSDYQVGNGTVSYSGPSEWSFRRFILHYAALCAAAGGVEAFCIGSEMVALTQIRGAGDSFPAVEQLKRLAADVRTLLGPSTKISYAADWSEYFGYQPADGSGDLYFHLDPLWSDPEIDFIGIDNYMPISDWRDGYDHADAQWGSIYNLEYLKSNIAGGEGFDWYYPDEITAGVQNRVPITDGAYGEPWVYRYKDLRAWWSNTHFDRPGGIRSSQPTEWAPQSKPIWFTELGCAAIDKGTNQPNKFLDPKSSESRLPRASNGRRDDLIQMQYLRAKFDFWQQTANNPVSPIYGGPMVDMGRAHVWAWDARPYPWFPGLPDVWSDGDNYARGHWLNGRVSSRSLSDLVSEICSEAALTEIDTSDLYGLVRGYSTADVSSGRSVLQPLMMTLGFDALERDGKLVFRNRSGNAAETIGLDQLARHPDQEADFLSTRLARTELVDRVRLNYVAGDGDYAIRSIEATYPGAEGNAVSQNEFNLVLTAADARAAAERWLAEARVARDTARFALPPSYLHLGPGDVVGIPGPEGTSNYRIDRVEQLEMQLIEAVRTETEIYEPGVAVEERPALLAPPVSQPPIALLLDLPLLRGESDPVSPYAAVAASPWPGPMAIFASATDSDYRLNSTVELPAIIGETLTPLDRALPGLLDRAARLRIRISSGELSSVPRESLLNGANAMAIGNGSGGNWEVFQFLLAEPVSSDVYELRMLLRGQLGTDALMPSTWASGSTVVLLDEAPEQISLSPDARGLERFYRIGPSNQPFDHPSYLPLTHVASGAGLRPFSPVHLRVSKTADASHHFTWIRRTRIDGDSWELQEVPLGESGERYRIRVRSGGELIRSSDVGQSSWLYSAADRAIDGVSAPYEFAVAQLSDRFGPGPFERINVDD